MHRFCFTKLLCPPARLVQFCVQICLHPTFPGIRFLSVSCHLWNPEAKYWLCVLRANWGTSHAQKCWLRKGTGLAKWISNCYLETKIKRPSEQHMIVIWLRFCRGRQDLPLCSSMAPGVHRWRWTPGTLWNPCQDPFSRKDFSGVVRSNCSNQEFGSSVASTVKGGRQGRAVTPRRVPGVAASLWSSLKLSTRLPLCVSSKIWPTWFWH